MKCLICKKEVDPKINVVPPTWFGAYEQDRCKAVICSDCIKTQGHNWADKVWGKSAS